MTSQIHLIIAAFDSELQNVVRNFKKFIEEIKKHVKVDAKGFYGNLVLRRKKQGAQRGIN